MSSRQLLMSISALSVTLGGFLFGLGAQRTTAEGLPADRFFELRTYTTHEGKLEALHKRFREHTNRIFQKHGMQLVGYWTPADEPDSQNTLVYLLAFPSREARDVAFEAFRADPEWQAVYKESHRDGPIVKKVESQFLVPTDYSPIK